VSIDGAQVAQTQATSVRVPSPVADGRHTWQVTASNSAGEQSGDRPRTVFIDTVPPVASVTVYGHKEPGARLHIYVAYADRPPVGAPSVDASGIAKVTVTWGDGTSAPLAVGRHRSFHVYRRPARYRVVVTVTDKAGNATSVVTVIKVTKPNTKKSRKGK
jgi:hypothetical protein